MICPWLSAQYRCMEACALVKQNLLFCCVFITPRTPHLPDVKRLQILSIVGRGTINPSFVVFSLTTGSCNKISIGLDFF